MPTKKMCVVCGFTLPRLQRTDTEYCGSTCRVRSHRARKREVYRERWEELRRLYREIRERELIRPLSGRYPFPLRARRTIAALEAQIQELLAGERQQHANTEQRLAEAEAQTSVVGNATAEEIERLQEHQHALERARDAAECELERARAEADEERYRANQAERQLQEAELRAQEQETAAEREPLPIEPVSVISQRESKLVALIQAERRESANQRRAYLAAQSSSNTHSETLSEQLSVLQKELVQTHAALSRETSRSERLQQGMVQMRAALHRENAGRIGAQSAVREGRVALDRVKKQRVSFLKHARDVIAEQEVRTNGESQAVAAITKERDKALKEAAQAKANLEEGVAKLQEHQQQLKRNIEEFIRQKESAIQEHRHDGSYHPNLDPLVKTMLEYLIDSSSLAHWQAGYPLRITGRPLLTQRTLLQQAYDLAMAARWALIADPPQSRTRYSHWQPDGHTLDADSESFLCKQVERRQFDRMWKLIRHRPLRHTGFLKR
jgi:hypothetical protein